MIALIDGDIVVHRVAYTTENDEDWVPIARCDEMIDGILMETGSKEFKIFLSDSKENNFRYQVSPDYKANRIQPKPKHYNLVKEHLIKEWGAVFAYGMEADDALGIAQDKLGQVDYIDGDEARPELSYNTVICSIDKDLMQIPGNHYNFVKKEWKLVQPKDGLLSFYTQILVGDVGDNVRGCPGIGPVKAGKALGGFGDRGSEAYELALCKSVISVFRERLPETPLEQLLGQIRTAARLLKIKQREDEPLWDFPQSGLTEANQLSSIPQMVAVTGQSTVPTMQERGLDGSPQVGFLLEDALPTSKPASTSQEH